MGRILIGLALIFLSLDLIRDASAPLVQSAAAASAMTYLSNDLITAFLLAAIFAWLVHSSVAAVLLFATLAAQGLLPGAAANAMVLGANLGGSVIAVMLRQGSGGDIVNIATDHMVTCGTPDDVCPNLPTCPWNQPGQAWTGPPRPTGGGDQMDLYDASKWGLNGFLYAWAKALRQNNIRVNAFCMGATDSYMLRSFHNFEPSDEEVASWMRAEDNAAALIALLTEGPDGRNAQNMNFCIGRPVRLEPPNPQHYILLEDKS